MVRIAYGVNSEGMGHTTRSSVAIDYLLEKGHEVHIFTSDRAYDFFIKKGYKNVYQIKGFHLIYHKDSLSNIYSTFHILKDIPKNLLPSFQTIAKRFHEILPEVVISDFESFTAFLGKNLGIPVISANNISIIDKTHVESNSLSLLYPKLMAVTTAQLSTLKVDYYVIPSFFFPKTKGRNVFLTDPAVRPDILKAKPTVGNHILVYQTSPTCLGLLKTLNKIDEKFIIYGFGKKRDRKNLTFYDFSTTRFIKHLASAKAVIIGGGFSLLSEALYLKKPIMSVPLRRHFEQITNAYYVEKMKFGEYHKKPTAVDVQDFILKLPMYRHYLDRYAFDAFSFPKKVEQLARKVAKAPGGRRIKALKTILFAK
jgi:uncharacterized protein (TIGR00661 family)